MPDPTATPPPGPRKLSQGTTPRPFGDYEIEGELGRGGMGVVYLARQKKLNRRVALKMLTGHYGPDELQRFLAEAETAAGLHHANIAYIYEVGEHEGTPFYSMEHVEGGSLADRLRKELPTPRNAAQLLVQVARALHFAHQNGVIHRDMKPGNVLLDSDSVPKVADFGIAKRLKEETHLTVSGAVIGTPTYMAPEQAKGTSRDVGPTADVYSLGAILYEMLAGRPPFLPEDSETAITVRVLTEDPVSPAWHRPGIPRDLEVICMKCLEKEPRDRYQSAAAFAEDLRRFLEDETIIARPPTTVVRTIKWVRRHPWKFLSRAAAVLVLILGLLRLAQWEMYEHVHFEYATGIDIFHGEMVPSLRISAAQANHYSVSYRFTRNGRRGHVTRVDALNSSGHPAAVLQFFGYDLFANWIDGITGVQKPEDRRREATSVQFGFRGNTLAETIALDANGRPILRTVFEVVGGWSSHSVLARFFGGRGFDLGTRQATASVAELERDAAGRDIRARFFNSSGEQAQNAEGVYGYDLVRDQKGRIIQLMNVGRDGRPAANRVGVVGLQFTWTPQGKMIRGTYLDADGKPTTFNGVAAIEYQFDRDGNVSQTRFVNDKEQLANSGGGVAQIDLTRDGHGEITAEISYRVDTAGQLIVSNKRIFAYDQFGYPADIQLIGPTSIRSKFKFDSVGNVLEEQCLDPSGQLMLCAKQWAIRRVTHSEIPSPPGWREDETYFDTKEMKAFCSAGHHRQLSDFDQNGNLRRIVFEDNNPARYKYFRYVSTVEYDTRGRLRHAVVRYEDKQGQLAIGSGRPFTGIETDYDDDERPTVEWNYGCDVEAMGAPIYRTDTEWFKTGARKRRVRQAYDGNRQPLAVVSNGTAAHYEERFDEIDQLERINETGFDESVVGYSSREARFDGGKLQEVIHRRGDGTALDSVQVFIKNVFPEQPKAAELHPGDQLVAANDKPVTTAYAWRFAGTFPGGWIEVIRASKRIRIDGFEEGSLGVVFEDRAPGKPMSDAH
jgi:tRNA A-37 threonylcarbamoyl transferase component Bud32